MKTPCFNYAGVCMYFEEYNNYTTRAAWQNELERTKPTTLQKKLPYTNNLNLNLKMSQKLLVIFAAIFLTSKGCKAYCSECIGFHEDGGETVKQNQSLSGHVLESFLGLTSSSQCFYRCVDDCRCMSFNFQVASSGNGSQLCEKNSVDAFSHPEAMEKRSGFAYHGIKLSPQSKVNLTDLGIINFIQDSFNFAKTIADRSSGRMWDATLRRNRICHIY